MIFRGLCNFASEIVCHRLFFQGHPARQEVGHIRRGQRTASTWSRRVSGPAFALQDKGFAKAHDAKPGCPERFVSQTALAKSNGPGRILSGITAFLILATLGLTNRLSAQSSGQIGLPVIFVHGICDTPDSFLPAEEAVRATLESHYPTQYPLPATPSDPDEYVVFYNGETVTFQVPPINQYTPPLNPDQVDTTRRFFLVALDDPSQNWYQLFDETNEVANIPIYEKERKQN